MDGQKVWRWNKIVWLLLAGTVTFLFWQVLLNDQFAYYDSIQQTTPAIALIVGCACLALSFGTWLFFKLKKQRLDGQAVAAATIRRFNT